jgi:hypothetical protein
LSDIEPPYDDPAQNLKTGLLTGTILVPANLIHAENIKLWDIWFDIQQWGFIQHISTIKV